MDDKQLMECLTVLARTLSLFDRDPAADARQVVLGNAVPRVLGLRHQLFGHAVVFVRGKPLFLAMVCVHDHSNDMPSPERHNRHPIRPLPRQKAVVVDD